VNISLLTLGFLLGMRHALESDHVAAVASLASRNQSLGDSLRQGAVWGVGHTLALLFFGSIVLLLDAAIPQNLAQALEFTVGLMLIILGLDVLRRLLGERIHVHPHRHADGSFHIHAHSHTGKDPHPPVHQHAHPGQFPLRALLVGIMHGMAGSAALILLTLHSVHSPLTGLAYILLFGVGSIGGMAALSVVIALPLRYSFSNWRRGHIGLQALVGMVTLGIGSVMVYQIAVLGYLPV